MFIPDIYCISTTCITHSSIHVRMPHTHMMYNIYFTLLPEFSSHERSADTWFQMTRHITIRCDTSEWRNKQVKRGHPKPPSCIKKSIAYLIYANSAWRSTWLHHVAVQHTVHYLNLAWLMTLLHRCQATRAEQASLYHFEKEQSLRSFKLFRPRLCIPHFNRFSLFVLVAHKGSGPLLLGYYGSLIGCETAWSCCSNNVVIPFLRLSEIVNVLIRLRRVVVGLSGFAPYPSSDSLVSSSWFEILHPKC